MINMKANVPENAKLTSTAFNEAGKAPVVTTTGFLPGLLAAGLLLGVSAWVPQAAIAKDKTHDEHETSVSCGDNLSQPGNYEIDNDLYCTSTIKITSSDVHLDLGGHTLTCSGPDEWNYPPESAGYSPEDIVAFVTGIEVNFNEFDDRSQEPVVTGVKIRNGTVTNCSEGILLYKADRSQVTEVNFVGNTLEADCCAAKGLELTASNNSHIRDNTFSGNSYAIGIFFSSGNKVRDNHLNTSSLDGLLLGESSGNKISKNTMDDNAGAGIWLEESENNQIKNNVIRRNGDAGILLIGPSNGNVIRKNQLLDNASSGVAMLGIPEFGIPVPADNVIRKNTSFGNGFVDLGEIIITDFFGAFNIEPAPDCSNIWKKNDFEAEVGPIGCIE